MPQINWMGSLFQIIHSTWINQQINQWIYYMKPLNLLTTPELRRCVKVEVAVLGSLSLTVLKVPVDVKQHWTQDNTQQCWSLAALSKYESFPAFTSRLLLARCCTSPMTQNDWLIDGWIDCCYLMPSQLQRPHLHTHSSKAAEITLHTWAGQKSLQASQDPKPLACWASHNFAFPDVMRTSQTLVLQNLRPSKNHSSVVCNAKPV